MEWPATWNSMVAGQQCSFCARGRVLDSPDRLLIRTTEVTDTYMPRRALVRGYVVVVWQAQHVVEPHHLNDAEAAAFHSEVLRVGRAIEACFRPMKINYMTAGNEVPHLHTHVTARYFDDPAPGAPLPAGQNHPMPEAQWHADAQAMRRELGRG
ncbi:MAG: HIT domain-containing protein [Actinoplanes sp.]